MAFAPELGPGFLQVVSDDETGKNGDEYPVARDHGRGVRGAGSSTFQRIPGGNILRNRRWQRLSLIPRLAADDRERGIIRATNLQDMVVPADCTPYNSVPIIRFRFPSDLTIIRPSSSWTSVRNSPS